MYDLEISGSRRVHDLNDLKQRLGARLLYFNFDDPRLLFLMSGYLRFFPHFSVNTLRSQGQGQYENNLSCVGAKHMHILIMMIHDFGCCFFNKESGIRNK